MVKQLCGVLAWFEAVGALPLGAVERVEARAEELERVADDPHEAARVLADILPEAVELIRS